MGRKKMGETEIYDNIGEKVDLKICPCCNEHPDCFSNIDGKCVALNECGGQRCIFYKNREQAVTENKAAYKKLKENNRIDLILKYEKVLSAIGAFDDDVVESEAAAHVFNNYQAEDYQKRTQALIDTDHFSQLVQEIKNEEETKYQRLVKKYEAAVDSDIEDENIEEGC